MNRQQLANFLDSTLLKPEAGPKDIVALVLEAAQLQCYAVCVSPSMVAAAKSAIDNLSEQTHKPKLAAVIGFPSGKHTSEIKSREAQQAVADGAAELDMVIDIAAALAGDFAAIETDIAAVRRAAPKPIVLKVILETAALSEEAIVGACAACMSAGADFVKTSTGFHPAGGASVAAVRLMRKTVGAALGVKASGGIRTQTAALEMLAAGANRLGVSQAAAILTDKQESTANSY